VITQKDGSLYLWYGVVTMDNPRIFIGRGSEEHSAETLVMEWTSRCSENPAELDRSFATIIHERANRSATRPRK